MAVPSAPALRTLRLPAVPPVDAEELLAWFAARAVTGVEEVDVAAGRYHRNVVVGDHHGRPATGTGTVELRADATGIEAVVDLPPDAPLGSVVGAVRRLWGLDADVTAIAEHLGDDPILGAAVASRPGLRVPGAWTGTEAAVRAVVGQQISVAAARTVLGRMAAAHGTPVGHGRAFPTADALADAPLEELGIFGRRAETIRTVTTAIAAGDLPLDGTVPYDDLLSRLVAVPGIGPWTAEYIALRLGEPDAFPAGDLHLMRVLGARTEREARARAEPWRPWRAHAAMYLWTSPEEVPS